VLVHLPPHVRENLEREQQVDTHIFVARYWDRAFKQRDPRLSVVFAKAGAKPPLVPERWHVKRVNGGDAPDSYMPVTTPSGGYREPGLDTLEELGRRDLWRTPRALEDFHKERDREKDARARDAARKREDRKDEVADVIKTLDSKSIVVKEKP